MDEQYKIVEDLGKMLAALDRVEKLLLQQKEEKRDPFSLTKEEKNVQDLNKRF